MKLFLDTSVLLAAVGSAKGASRYLITASRGDWELISSDYCEEETIRNLPKLGEAALSIWKEKIAPRVNFVSSRVSLDKPLIFPKAKDRPVLISALAARADWLLTLDERDFQNKLGPEIYGMRISSPGEFLLEQRAHGLI